MRSIFSDWEVFKFQATFQFRAISIRLCVASQSDPEKPSFAVFYMHLLSTEKI